MIAAYKLKLGAAALSCALIAALGLSLWAARAKNSRLEQAAAAAQNEVTALKQELAGQLAALMRREAEGARLAARAARLKNELARLYEENDEAGAWGAGRVPDTVLERLCPRLPASPAAGGLYANCSGAGFERHRQR